MLELQPSGRLCATYLHVTALHHPQKLCLNTSWQSDFYADHIISHILALLNCCIRSSKHLTEI